MAATVAIKGLFGIGDRSIAVINVTGPTSYTQITVGVPPAGPTGGQVITAQACGLKQIEVLLGALDTSGTYNVIGTRLPVASTAQFPNTMALEWITAHTGAEVTGATNLSTFMVKVVVIGR